MNTVEYLVKKLEEFGINDFFGLPGDYNFNIVYAIQNNPNTNWIGCINELNAGYAADGYAREKGFGAVVTTYGVGELSAINAIAGSYAENVPVISIVGAPSSKLLKNKTLVHHQFNDINPQAFIEAHKSVTQASAFLTKDNAKLEIDRVLKVFAKEKKPVYICIPEDIAVLEISERDVDYGWISDMKTLQDVVKKINEKIKKAKHPVILADVLTKRFNAAAKLREFAEKSGIPATNFPMGMGIIDSGFKNYLGTYLSEYGNLSAKKYLETTDCLIASGVIYSDMNSMGFKLPYKINSQIAIYGTYTYIDGIRYDNIKMADVLEKLSEIIEYKDYGIKDISIGYEHAEPEGQLTSDYIYPRLQEFLQEGDIIFADAGLVPYGIFKSKLPDNTSFNVQALWCSIGWATPAAFGAATAKPSSRIVLVTGEGAHQISAMEVGNMLRFGKKIVVIVINNNGYTVERVLSGRPENELNEIVSINYSKFARIFEGDIWSTRVETADDFDKALKVTGIMNKLCYIEACTSKEDVPALANEYFGKKSMHSESKSKKTKSLTDFFTKTDDEKKTKKSSKTEKEPKLNRKGDIFSTTVHESLQHEETENG